MNSLSIALVFSLSLTFALAAPSSQRIEKEQKADQECNATIPVYRDIRSEFAQSIATGKRLNFSQNDKCFLNCFLQKVGFLDNNSNIRNGAGLVNFTLRLVPQFAKYSDIIIANVFQIARSTKGIEDKCQKAFVIYHQFAQCTFVLSIASDLQSGTGIKDKIVDAIENETPVDQDIGQQVKQHLGFLDAMIQNYVEQSEKSAQRAAI